MGRKNLFVFILVFIFFLINPGFPNENSDSKSDNVETNIANLLGLYGVKLSGQWYLSYQNGKSSDEKFNNFSLKRGYITIEKTLNEHLSGRITPDITVDRQGDGEGNVELRLKYCYMKYSAEGGRIFTKPYVEFGLVHRPWLDFEEHINRYRVQGTMFLERNHLFNSADFGVTFVTLFGGQLDDDYMASVNKSYPGKYGSMAIGIYNGGGYHALEKNLNKSIETRFSFRPFPAIIPGMQITYTGAFGKGNTASGPDWDLNAGFLSWEHEKFVFTGTYYTGNGNFGGNALNSAGESLEQDGYSIFAEYKIDQSNLNFIWRYDFFKQKDQTLLLENNRYIFGISYDLVAGSKLLLDYDYEESTGVSESSTHIVEFVVEVHY